MAHFARVHNGVVMEVIVAEPDFVHTLDGVWYQTSYNTEGGVHKLGGSPLRKNFASVGGTYDADKDAFIPVKPFNSWVLDGKTCLWQAPTAMPDDGNTYYWDEENTQWSVSSVYGAD